MIEPRRLVLDLCSQRPVWRPPAPFVRALVAAGGEEWRVDVV